MDYLKEMSLKNLSKAIMTTRIVGITTSNNTKCIDGK